MMTKWRDKSSHEIELHRLKNRIRQQKYRARKREEKARAVGSRPVYADLFISSLSNVTKELHLGKHDMGSLNLSTTAEDGIRLTESGYEDIGKCDRGYSPVEAEPIQKTCTEKLEGQQEQGTNQCNGGFIGTDAAGDLYVSLGGCQSSASNTSHQLLPELEQGYGNTLQIEHDSSPKSLDRIMARRIKNRARQRRYRARRRLEADMRRIHLVQESTSPILELQQNSFTTNPENQVYCQRNWKEDARKARGTTQPDLTSTVPQPHVLHFAIEHQTPISSSEVIQPVEIALPSEHLAISEADA